MDARMDGEEPVNANMPGGDAGMGDHVTTFPQPRARSSAVRMTKCVLYNACDIVVAASIDS